VIRAKKPPERKSLLLRLDPNVHDAIVRWADDELRSGNAQIEFLLCEALSRSGRLSARARSRPTSSTYVRHRRKAG
jgi:hypothetical protein